jgi:hypothetical protein
MKRNRYSIEKDALVRLTKQSFKKEEALPSYAICVVFSVFGQFRK